MKIKWTDMDLQTAFEDGCKFKDLEDLKDFLKKRKQLSERQTPTNDKKEADSKALNIAVVIHRFTEKELQEKLKEERVELLKELIEDCKGVHPEYYIEKIEDPLNLELYGV